MMNPLVLKLAQSGHLNRSDHVHLEKVCEHSRHVEAGQDLIQEGDHPGDVHLVLTGFACRYKVLPDGRRQNMALLLPGDFCDLHVAILGTMDHSIATLSPCTMVRVPRDTILELTENHPSIARALWWCTLVDEGTLREWLVNVAQRGADQRIAHLLCELHARLTIVDLVTDRSFEVPMTQGQFGETLGLTSVHINRMIQKLRDAGLINWRNKRVTIPDVKSLEAFCDFTPNYLHLREWDYLSQRPTRVNSPM